MTKLILVGHYVGNNYVKFLVDTGACLSIISPKVLEKCENIIRNPENVEISGIAQTKIKLTESVEIPINEKYSHKFYIADLKIPQAGIIGLDFLDRFNCIIDVGLRSLSFYEPIDKKPEIIKENVILYARK